jgi:phage terminase small subunit
MGTRGRKSSAELSVVPLLPRANRLRPPAHLGPEEAKIFREIVSSCHPQHFAPSDVYLLAAYCEAIVISRRAAAALHEDQGAAAVWERAVRVLATLATRLRLAPQSRSDPKTVARRTGYAPPSYYDEMRDAEDAR